MEPVLCLAQVWEIPEVWSLRDAATVPVAYMTAYYSLIMRGRLEASQRVLIHSGTGAVGLAAIRICLHRRCEVGTPPLYFLGHLPCHVFRETASHNTEIVGFATGIDTTICNFTRGPAEGFWDPAGLFCSLAAI